MREMILNHASLFAPGSNCHSIMTWLKDVAVGMSHLVSKRVVDASLRTAKNLSDTLCLADYTYFDACMDLQRSNHREEYLFLMRMASKYPLLDDVGEEVRDRFLGCQELKLADRDGEPLVLCAIDDGIAVGFPSAPTWDSGRLTVDFEELLPDETFGQASEEIDQLTRSGHAHGICDRHRDRIRVPNDPKTLWENRGELFPGLIFGPGVQDNLRTCANQLSTIAGKLLDLDRSAQEWSEAGGSAPSWRTKVTPESEGVRNNRKLLAERKFQSHAGSRELFEWHARFGNGGRIHLRFDPRSREVEIGYIGNHLPL